MDKLYDYTLGQMIEIMAEKHPDHEAVKYTERDYRRTYKEFDEETDLYAKGLLGIGLKKGDHLAVWMTNYPEWLIALFAAAKIGIVLITVNTNYRIHETEYILRQSDANCLIICDGLKDIDSGDIMYKLCPELATSDFENFKSDRLPCLKFVISVDSDKPGMLRFEDLKKYASKISDEQLKEVKNSLNCHETINMQYTSGTTGFPKGVMLSHYNILNNGMTIGDNMLFTHKDRLLICVPFFHCFGLVLAILACVTHGSTMVPLLYYNPTKVLQTLAAEKCTAFHGVPTMFIGLLEHPDFDKYDLSSLRTGIMAGSSCPVKFMEDAMNKMNMKEITIVYGQTESSPGCTQSLATDSAEIKATTVGKAMAFIETKIVDPETGKTLPPDTIGEFCARGYNLMKGYYKMPEATAQAIDSDGWLHTGDLATVDENGYYKITGRLKDMIIRGGENIYAKEIEEFLYHHPKIKDVQIIGVPSKQYGEEVMACVILKNGQTMTEEEVKEYVRSSMARHKVPSYVKFTDSFPMTASGKIQKYIMREQAAKELGLSETE
jgi:fatty-acyl-CoA synthase